jgi:hypothetical protein
MSTSTVTHEITPEVTPGVMPEVATELVVPVPVPAVPVPVQQRYEYQPVDDFDRPMGGKQVIVYTTNEELIEKLTKNHIESIKGMRAEKRKSRLGAPETDLPTDIERLSSVVTFKEKPLTTEERYAISQDLNDPTKFDSARDRLFESAVGVPPAKLRDTLNQTQQQTQQILARQNAEVWLERHPEFYSCQENINTVCEWMTKQDLSPSVRNFEFAQKQMEEAGLLLSSPIVREVPPVVTPVVAPVAVVVPNPQAPALEPVRINETPVPQSSAEVSTEKRVLQAHVPSGLNNRTAPIGGAIVPSAMDSLTLQKIDLMSSEEYRKEIMTNPAFVKRVNELEATRPPRPRRS